MLDVNNVLPTPYQKVIERWRFADQMFPIEKEQKKEES